MSKLWQREHHQQRRRNISTALPGLWLDRPRGGLGSRNCRDRFSGAFIGKRCPKTIPHETGILKPDFNRSRETLISPEDNGSKEETTVPLFLCSGTRAVPIHCKFNSQ